MKVLPVASFLVASFGPGVEAWQLRRVAKDRNLLEGFEFIVSNASSNNDPLCITAVEGTKEFGGVELRSCDLQNAPPEQLWSRQGNKFVSGLSSDLCMMVNHGKNLFDGVRLRLGQCGGGLNEFTWNDGHADRLRVLSDESFCLTCTGSTASSGDRVLAKPCLERADYKWTFTAADVPKDDSLGVLYELVVYEADACVQPKDANDYEAPIILDQCDESRAWYVKEKIDGSVIFHSAIDPDLCLQAGFCHAKDGTWLRLLPCDADESLQLFSWQDYEAPIKLADNDDLCMVYQGSSAEVGDLIIMKNCADRTYEWSGDAN